MATSGFFSHVIYGKCFLNYHRFLPHRLNQFGGVIYSGAYGVI